MAEKTIKLADRSKDNHRTSTMFSAVRYKAKDYVYEASARQKLTRSWLVLPVPYHLDCTDLYPHTGTLPEVIYRTPWARGDPVEVVPSSNPASQADLGEALWLLDRAEKVMAREPCAETFSNATLDQFDPSSKPNDLYLKEELIFADALLRFREQLPQFRAVFGRLKTVTVPDPLLAPTGNGFSEDLFFRYCLPYEVEVTSDVDPERRGPAFMEKFSQKCVLHEESLMLPLVLESCFPKKQDSISTFREFRQSLEMVPEQTENHQSCVDMLRKGAPASLWASAERYGLETFQGLDDIREQLKPMDTTLPARFRLYPELETELPLTPPCPFSWPPPQAQLSCASLPAEQMSPVFRHKLVSDSAREGMEEVLWKTEKHLQIVLGLLLAEPQTIEPALQYRPISEAFKLVTAEVESHGTTIREQVNFDLRTGIAEITDSLASGPSEALETLTKGYSRVGEETAVELCDESEPETEDFLPLSFSQMDNILTECSDDTDFPAQPSTVNQIEERELTEAIGSSHEETQEREKMIVTEEAVINRGVEPNPMGGLESDRWFFPVQNDEGAHRPTLTRPSIKDLHSTLPVSTPKEDLDPLSTFMMLRSQQRASVATQSQSTSRGILTRPEPKRALERKEELKPGVHLGSDCVTSAGRGSDGRTQESSCQERSEARYDSQVIQVHASESQRWAYQQLQAAASLCLASARGLGLQASAYGDFSTLTSDCTRFLLKQQEKELSTSIKQGEPGEKNMPLYKQVALIHLLVTARDLLLRCDLNTAVDYLARAKETNMDSCLDDLWSKLRVVQYLSQRNEEPSLKIVELQQQMREWVEKNRTQKPCAKALVIITMDSDSARAIIVKSLSHITDVLVSAVLPEDSGSKLDCRRVKESLHQCWCVVVCGQHIGPDFPWQCFSLVVEYDQVSSSAWATVCRERNISHVSVWTTVPHCEGDSTDTLEQVIPFTLVVTEGLLHYGMLLQMLESVYNITVLERDYPDSLQMLGRTSRYSVITVDECTAVVIQEVEELSMERSSENFVLRMTALSLQYSCCWVILYCAEGQSPGYSFNSDVFNNLVLIYSSFVLFGLRSEDLDVKVLITDDASDMARWVRQISHQTLMGSGRDPLQWLDRDWLSVLPSEEEKCLALFPSVNPMVAQLMLRRAPSLSWLLRATLTELQVLLPEVPHKVIKLFSDTTALYKLNASHSPPGSPAEITQRRTCGPWGADAGDLHCAPEMFDADYVNPFNRSPKDIGGRCADELLVVRDEAEEFAYYFGSADADCSTVPKTGMDHALRADENRGAWIKGYVNGRRENEWSGRSSSPNESAWSLRSTKYPTAENSLQAVLSIRHRHSPQQLGGKSCKTFLSSKGFTDQEPVTCPTFLVPPTPVGSQWSSKVSPFGGTVRHAVGGPCEYRADAGASTEFSGCLRPDRKRTLGSFEEMRAGLPQLKKGKLTYEKVPGRSDGQTRLTFF